MTSRQPDFATACLLSYNRPRFLAQCLQTLSLGAQHAPIEVIVHDDGSVPQHDFDPDAPKMPDYLLNYLEAGRVSTVLMNPPGHNQGQGVALNRMFGIAKGDPILKVDQDIIFHEAWLQRVNYLLETNRDAAERGAEPRIGLLALMHYHHDPVDSAKTKLEQFVGWSSRTHILGSAFAVTRECWEALGPFDEHSDAFAEDWSFQQRVTESREFVCALPDDDLCVNQGFGVGPSTVVVAPETVATIHKGPHVIGRA